MPGIFYRPISRKRFLTQSLKAAAACVVVARLTPFDTRAVDESLHLALLSDTHVAADPKAENRKFLPAENLRLTVSQVLEARPQAIIHDGDLARATGELDDYEAVKKLLTPLAEQWPVYMGMGNHDNRDNFHKVFAPNSEVSQKITDKHVLVIDWPALRIVLLDSLLYVNKTPGFLGKAQRDWLDAFLARSDSRPTVLFVHHTLGDNDGELLDAPAFLQMVRPYRKVKAIFYGHSHQYAYAQDHGIHLVNLPAVGYNFVDHEPVGWVDGRFSAQGVDLTLKAFGGNRAQDGKTVSLVWRST
jgi:3',5'-cyclic AMP phosphodiesterase CpdA